jgi:hypothetical protein
MKHLKTFESYVNYNENDVTINENVKFVSDDRFKDEATLKADILKNAGPALEKFLKDNGIDWPGGFVVEDAGNRIKLVSKPVTGDDLGIMQYGFKEVYLSFFGGGNFPQINKAAKEGLEFEPSIWTNLNYSYKHTSGGTNGTNFIIPGSNDSNIWYDIVNGVWLDRKGAQKAGF